MAVNGLVHAEIPYPQAAGTPTRAYVPAYLPSPQIPAAPQQVGVPAYGAQLPSPSPIPVPSAVGLSPRTAAHVQPMPPPGLTHFVLPPPGSLPAPFQPEPQPDLSTEWRQAEQALAVPTLPSPDSFFTSLPTFPNIAPFDTPSPPFFNASVPANMSALQHPSFRSSPALSETRENPLSEHVLIPRLKTFFERMSPIMPVYTRSWIFGRIEKGEHRTHRQFAAMLLALCAFTLVQPLQAGDPGTPEDRKREAEKLLEECVRIKSGAFFPCDRRLNENEVASSPWGLEGCLTSFYHFGCLFGMSQDDAAWFRLREAVTLGQLLKIDDPTAYDALPLDEQERRIRTYWLLSITERAYALQRGHPIGFDGRPGTRMETVHQKLRRLQAERNHRRRSSVATDVSTAEEFPVSHLDLFGAVDQDFLDCWNEKCSGDKQCSRMNAAKALSLFAEFNNSLNKLAPSSTNPKLQRDDSEWQSDDIQRADLLVTQQWLLNRLWRLCLSHGLVFPDEPNPPLRTEHAIHIAARTLSVCDALSMSSIEAHGIGFVEKLYDIATSLTPMYVHHDALVRDGVEVERYSELNRETVAILERFLGIFRRFRGGDHSFLPALVASVEGVVPGFIRSSRP
ncbi:hypothetical protein YB2330_004961 [Saitoella coloradoensis]